MIAGVQTDSYNRFLLLVILTTCKRTVHTNLFQVVRRKMSMRNLLPFLFFIVAFCGSSRADDAYLAAGVAATDRVWTSADYATLAKLISEKKVPLPLVIDPLKKKIIDRVCSLENLELGRNKSLAVVSRLQEFLVMHQATAQLLKVYVSEAASGAHLGEETSRLISFILHVSALGVELVDEFLPTLAKDETYEVRMQGLAKMKSGLSTVFSGMYTSIAVDSIYTDSQRSSMLKAVASTIPQFVTVLSDDTKTEFARKYAKCKERFKSESDQGLLEQIVSQLNGKQSVAPKPTPVRP